ncbi:hypothetical protein [Actinokineospora globicatena]|uniref:Secreted protein n=1 Tax=Actinokineospora globicatena TaxID=103729 RepID=A0A9W6V946_9PSEU|nr:hypothetical protein [Actinokineospora globicatena]MCP2304568.1 hypothetical protein [Actinokineospora globicatena]GLW78063.1 hypothetical protein Aglo01_25450 [Actinokineospora globicatena]GLW85271.1 hypothetical protein Aglo02_29110 [Actinokineospora globicatena]GLW90651.1 hypothetical protein Aglo03_14670 [Actinokineospora globicatena]
MRKAKAVAAAVLAVGAVVTGVTPASADYWARYSIGPYTDEAVCNYDSDRLWDPPYWYSYDCHYLTTDPDNRGRGAGYYFWNRVDIR